MHTTSPPSDFWQIELDALTRLGPWKTTADVLGHAIDLLLDTQPDLRQRVAFDLYQRDEVTLSRAAELAGVSLWQFRDWLRAQGIGIHAPEHDRDEMDDMIAVFFAEQPGS